MTKIPTLLCALTLAGASAARAQEAAPGDTGKLSPAATAADDTTKKTDAVKRGPTKITSTKEASFDGKLRMAIFLGDVHIDDPEFTLTSDKLTVYMKKQTPTAAGEKPKPGASPAPAAPGGGGLDRAIAEGNVVIEKMQPDGGTGQPVRYVGKAAKVEYYAATGDAVLSGWPQVLQGINMHVATEATTVMYLNREGRMRTEGRSETTIVDPGPGNPTEHK